MRLLLSVDVHGVPAGLLPPHQLPPLPVDRCADPPGPEHPREWDGPT